jgi:hypothetical protein
MHGGGHVSEERAVPRHVRLQWMHRRDRLHGRELLQHRLHGDELLHRCHQLRRDELHRELRIAKRMHRRCHVHRDARLQRRVQRPDLVSWKSDLQQRDDGGLHRRLHGIELVPRNGVLQSAEVQHHRRDERLLI